jgi:hypothetical protein
MKTGEKVAMGTKKKGLKIIIAGGRDFKDYSLMRREALKIIKEKAQKLGYEKIQRDIVTIISGTANGADQLGERFAKEFDLILDCYPADWQTNGKAAGPIRNKKMAEVACSDRENYEPMLIAFWDGKSRGTKSMIDIATKLGIDVKIVRY